MPEVPVRVLANVRQWTAILRLTLVDKAVSPTDGFTKYLFRGDGPAPFESVRIPLLHRPEDLKYIVCVSSQVGCALGCAFCATARLGFQRNLAAWEIVDQVMQVQADSPHPVRGVVFMGMGEPLLNYDRVMRAARILSEPCGLAIDAKAITISTVGRCAHDPPLHRRAPAVPVGRVADVGGPGPAPRTAADRSHSPVARTHGGFAGVSRSHRPPRHAGVDVAFRHQHQPQRRPPPGRVDARLTHPGGFNGRQRSDRPVSTAAGPRS